MDINSRFLRLLLRVPSKWVVSRSAAIMKTRGLLLHQICGVSTPLLPLFLRRGAHHITSTPPMNITQLSSVADREECGSHINENDSSIETLRLPTKYHAPHLRSRDRCRRRHNRCQSQKYTPCCTSYQSGSLVVTISLAQPT